MSRITMKDLMEAIQTTNANVVGMQNEVAALSNRVSALETKGTKSSGGTRKSSAKKTTSSKQNDFDRALYEETAKKLGVFYKGTVCATVKDGKVLATRKENRQKVYEAMGYKK